MPLLGIKWKMYSMEALVYFCTGEVVEEEMCVCLSIQWKHLKEWNSVRLALCLFAAGTPATQKKMKKYIHVCTKM